MNIAILGRQPELGIAEIEKVFGKDSVTILSDIVAQIDYQQAFDVQRFGGILKSGLVTMELPQDNWNEISKKIIQHYSNKLQSFEGKITLGISAYSFRISSREVQKIGIILKQNLKKSNVSLRLVPNTEPSLSTAASHHNKLGLSHNKIELLIVHTRKGRTIVAESTGAQNITAYANRDQKRPKRDAFIGMLPPKLAQIMINLACPPSIGHHLLPTILDPFCGTGVILQEALLMGYSAYGTDLSEKMINYSRDNLSWLADGHHADFNFKLEVGDAMKAKWQQPIDAVVSETYLGQPFSAPPSPTKLDEVVKNCNHIISEFLKNLSPQIKSGTSLCIAVPAWRDKNDNFTHLPLISTIARLGYKPHQFTNISQDNLLYYREDQVVARELLVLTKIPSNS